VTRLERFSPARLDELSWVQRTLLVGLVLSVLWSAWQVPRGNLTMRALRDAVVFIALPAALAITHGRHLGWRVDRRAIRNAVLIALFVLPALGSFLPHALQQFVVVVAAETYYRGLLCVGVRDEVGFKSVFISPIVYALHHVGKPPIELLLSGPTDVLFGAVDYDANSILPSIVAHGMGLALLDWLVLHPPLLPPEQVLEWLSFLPIPL
jgi:hypothetical protein